jgi:Domain of unknown function (DUF6457)
MSELDDWADAVCRELGLTEIDRRATIRLVLDLAREVAHAVDRPAAPLTAYLLGVAVGRADRPDAVGGLASRIGALAADWSRPEPASGPTATDSDLTATLRTTERRDQEPS